MSNRQNRDTHVVIGNLDIHWTLPLESWTFSPLDRFRF